MNSRAHPTFIRISIKMKSRISPPIVFSISPLIIFFFFISHSSLSHSHSISTRENLEIVIGGEAPPPETPYCPEPTPPPPPEECPPPPPPPSPPPPPPPEECPPPSPPPSPLPPPKSPPPPPPRPPHPPPKSPPPPPPHPPMPPKPNPPSPPRSPPFQLTPELQKAVAVIQRFKNTIIDDPFNVTATWNGRICSDPSKYKGFICDTTISDGKTRVALVNFNGFRLRGKPSRPLALRNFLDGLTDLIVFHSNSNNFTGGVPSVNNKLPSLFELDLSNNKLSGAFPPQVLAATNLTFLDLRFNFLAGKLPPAVFTLDLDVLFLNNNQFSGEIPASIGKTPALYLTLANNRFTGVIPATIADTSDTLLEILLLGNTISGCLPYQIGLLKKTTVFDASINRITGPIPHSFGCLESMQYLNISMNELYGAVPETLCKIKGLVKLTLSSNYITQVGPECRKQIAKKVLDLSMNCILDLPNQRSKETCERFFLRQQSCPDPESMNKVPCKVDYSGFGSGSGEKVDRKLAVEPPRTYAALEMHV